MQALKLCQCLSENATDCAANSNQSAWSRAKGRATSGLIEACLRTLASPGALFEFIR